MLTLEQAKKLLNNPAISDEEALSIRDHFYLLAEIIFEQWQKDNNYSGKPPSSKPEKTRQSVV